MKTNVALAGQVPFTIEAAMDWKPTTPQRKTAIMANYLRGAEAYIIVGKLLDEAHKNEDWRKDGSGAANFYEWVEKELTIKRSNANRMMMIWSCIGPLIPTHGELIRRIDFSKLSMIIPILRVVKEEQALLEWLHMAETNTVKDLENNIRESGKVSRKLKPTDTCMHDQVSRKLFVKCKKCGAFFPEEGQLTKRYLEALKTAKDAIKSCHGDLAWDTYNDQDPAMKTVNGMIDELERQLKVK